MYDLGKIQKKIEKKELYCHYSLLYYILAVRLN